MRVYFSSGEATAVASKTKRAFTILCRRLREKRRKKRKEKEKKKNSGTQNLVTNKRKIGFWVVYSHARRKASVFYTRARFAPVGEKYPHETSAHPGWGKSEGGGEFTTK